MGRYFLWEKGGKVYFELPTSWQVLTNVAHDFEAIKKTVPQMVKESVVNPIDTLPLEKAIKPNDKVVIIVDDFARPTPKKEIVTCLIDHLQRFGVQHDQIDILFGVGTHRPLSEHEVEVAMGEELVKKIRHSVHDCHSKKLVCVGHLKTGGEIKVNPLLVEADFRISVGSIIPHLAYGFGGGAKIILPGVCNYEAIREHHLAYMPYMFSKGDLMGKINDNPFYEEACEAARMANLDFIVNAVYNGRGDVKEIVSGHFKEAHQFGIGLSSKELSVKIDGDADVSIVSAFPLDEGPQIIKPLGPATMITKGKGSVILVARVHEGIPDGFLHAFDIAHQMAKGDPKRLVLEYVKQGKLIVENAPVDFNAGLILALLYSSLVNVIIVSSDINKGQAARLGFRYADSLDGAIKTVSENIPQAKVNILSAGGLIIPLLKKDFSFYQE